MKRRNSLALSPLLLLALTATLAGQEPAQPLVRLNVIVTGEKGKPAGEVRREDVRVFDEGAERAVAYFSKETLPVSYGLVVDNSGSLRAQMNAVIESARIIVENNAPGDEAFVLRFVDRERINMMQGFTADAARLQRALDEMYVEGGQTALVDAVYLAAEHLQQKSKPAADGPRRRALILITDGEDRQSYFKPDDLSALLRGSDIQIFCIGLVGALGGDRGLIRPSKREEATELLKRLAAETGGLAYAVKTGEDLLRAVTEISNLLHTQYVVGYAPPADPSKKSFRRVEVKIADAPQGGKRKAVTRPGYAVAGAPSAEQKKEK